MHREQRSELRVSYNFPLVWAMLQFVLKPLQLRAPILSKAQTKQEICQQIQKKAESDLIGEFFCHLLRFRMRVIVTDEAVKQKQTNKHTASKKELRNAH